MVRHGLSADARALYIGTATLPLDQVQSFEASGLSVKDLSTSFATIGLFSAVAAAFLFAVVETGWRTRFLLEGLLFGGVALSAAAEFFSARRRTLYTFKIYARSGDEMVFVTADPDQAQAVHAALKAALQRA